MDKAALIAYLGANMEDLSVATSEGSLSNGAKIGQDMMLQLCLLDSLVDAVGVPRHNSLSVHPRQPPKAVTTKLEKVSNL